jgi:hypothetical protein
VLLRTLALGLPLLLVACHAREPGPLRDPLVGWWVGPALTPGWTSSKAWKAGDPRATPVYCPLEFEFFEDGTVETNWLNDGSWASMCSFARLPYMHDQRDSSGVRFGSDWSTVRACFFHREGDRARVACLNARDPPHNVQTAMVLSRRDPEEREGLDAFVGEWRTSPFGDEVVDFKVRQDARFSFQAVDSSSVDDGWLDVRERTVELHGKRNSSCLYRATPRRLTLRCRPSAVGAPRDLALGRGEQASKDDLVLVLTRMR